jgi:hypothetical protein
MAIMSETSPAPDELRKNLQDLAQALREATHLEPESGEALANLMEELSQSVDPAALPSAATTHLAATAANLVQGLHQRQSPSLLTAARKRLQAATLRAEAEAPLATGIIERLLSILANFGI